MNEDDCLERFGLPPNASDADEIRDILFREGDKERQQQGQGNTELMKLCCVQLFSLGDVQDSLLIWGAKTSSSDASYSIDVRLLCGAGLEETKAFLVAAGASQALARVVECERAGNFEEFSPESQLEWYRRYYGTN